MTTSLRIELQETCPPRLAETEDVEDEISAVLDALCQHLEESGCVEFSVGGFGQDRWPVDVRTDLLTLVEQLPALVEAIREDALEFELDFFEQGMQRRLVFRRTDRTLVVTCVSLTGWQPIPINIHLTFDEWRHLLATLRRAFMHAATACCPQLVAMPSFDAWRVATELE